MRKEEGHDLMGNHPEKLCLFFFRNPIQDLFLRARSCPWAAKRYPKNFIFVRHAAIGDASGTDDAGSSARGVHDPCLTISHTCIPSSQASQAMQTM